MAGAQGHMTVRRKPKDGVNGTNGTNGIPGCILRQSEWAAGVEYRNDESLTSGTRYLDIAIVTSSANTFKAYKCKKTHTSSSSIPVTNTTYWEVFNSLVPVYTPLIMAQNALLRFTQTNQLLVMKSDNTTVAAGMGGGDYPLWAGAVTPANAPFKVSIAGKLYSTNAEIQGTIRADAGYFGIFQITTDNWGNGMISADRDDSYGDTHYVEITPECFAIGALSSQDGREIEYVRIVPYGDPDKFDNEAVVRIAAQNKSNAALLIARGHLDFLADNDTDVVLKMYAGMAQIRSKTLNLSSSTNLTANTTYILSCSSTPYLYLPSNPKQGDFIRIINNSTSYGFTIRSTLTKLIFNVRTNAGSDSDGSYHYIAFTTSQRVVELVYNGSYWCVYYL